MTKPVRSAVVSPRASTDAYVWNNPPGGSWSVASNWLDSTTGTTATAAPGAGNAVSIYGGASSYTSITGNGAAASLTVNGDVLQSGTIAVGGAVSLTNADYKVDGAASLRAASAVGSGTLETGGGSRLVVTGTATLWGALLTTTGASTARFGTLVMNSYGGRIAVDDTSSIEVGAAGGAALGAFTVDAGAVAALIGALDGNVIVRGALGVQAGGQLNIGFNYPSGVAAISGSGTLSMSEGSLLFLGVADSAAIQFADPGGLLGLAVLPTGTIYGFGVGETIELFGLADHVSYVQTSATLATLMLTEGGHAAGRLTLAGNFTGDLFQMSIEGAGDAFITVQTPGTATPQPGVILGTVGFDYLYATANNQALTGLGGGDSLDGAGHTGIAFKDSTANLNGAVLQGFDLSDHIDLTDLALGSTTISTGSSTTTGPFDSFYELALSDGTHSASITVSGDSVFPVGYFAASSDGVGGVNVKYMAVNTDADTWINPLGGSFATAGNWVDTKTGLTATVPPGYGNAITIHGGTSYLDVTGSGAAASLTTTGDVLLSGSVVGGGTVTGVSAALNQSGTLAIGKYTSLSLTSDSTLSGLVAVEGGTLAVGGIQFGSSATVIATGGGVVTFGGQVLGNLPALSVDGASSVEFGTAGNAAKGAVSIDAGSGGTLYGTVYGNLVVNGFLAIGGLVVAGYGGGAASITGGGTIAVGGDLVLSGADSAAMALSYRGSLTIDGVLPTGTISGFARSNAITLDQAVTGLSYAQGNGVGTLTLSNGATTIGTLTLAGTYVAGQFLLHESGTSVATTITYLPTPGTASGTLISTNTDSYDWNNSTGGVWSNAANWTDVTAGGTAHAPGANNAVIISSGTNVTQIVSGTGAAASLTAADVVFTGAIAVSGEFFSITSFLTAGARVAAGSFSGALDLSGGSTLAVSGAIGWASLVAVGGSVVTVAGTGSTLGTSFVSGEYAIDATSSMEFGSAGGAAAGALTVDAGQTVSGIASHSPFFGYNVTIAAKTIVNGLLDFTAPYTISPSPYPTTGTIEGFGGTVGAVTGSGTIEVDAQVRLLLKASDSAAILLGPGLNIFSSIQYPTLELAGPLPTATISGFAAGDVIQLDQPVTGFSYVQTNGTLATINLSDGGNQVGGLLLGGSFAGSLFHMDVAASTGFATLTLQAPTVAAGTNAVTTSHDSYAWVGASGGSWTTAANWHDATTGTAPTSVPGINNAVTIAGTSAANTYTTIGAGSAAAASLAVTGNVLLVGTLNDAGLLSIAARSGSSVPSELSTTFAKLTAASAKIGGVMEVGKASTLTVSGTASLAGTLEADRFSTVQLGALVGSGTIAIDGGSQIHIGAPVSPASGALSQAAGTTVALSGAIFGNLAEAGTLAVLGGNSLMIDMVGTAAADPYLRPVIGGAGTLSVGENSTLGLGAAATAAIQFAAPNGTLQLAALPSSVVSGFAVGDRIVIDKTVTGLAYAQTTATQATLTLTNGAARVGTLKLAGGFGGSLAFHLDPSIDGASATISLLSVGVAAVQPTLISGSAGNDLLAATANGQTLMGLAGTDTMSSANFTGLAFRDLTGTLAGDVIQNFATSDVIDFTDLASGSATLSYGGSTLSVTDGTHTATLAVRFARPPASGAFSLSSDSAGGTRAVWH